MSRNKFIILILVILFLLTGISRMSVAQPDVEASILIYDGDFYTNSTSVYLDLYCEVFVGLYLEWGIDELEIRNEGMTPIQYYPYWTGEEGWAYEDYYDWELTPVDGSKKVYVKYYYWYEEEPSGTPIYGSIEVSDTIFLDATPPEITSLISTTHPDPGTWYSNNNPSFQWGASDATTYIAGFSWVLDQIADTIPSAPLTMDSWWTYTDKADGVWYFHVRARDAAGNWSETAHLQIKIDATPPPPPTVTSLTHPDQDTWYNNNEPSFSWTASDPSGINGYSCFLDQSATYTPDTMSEGTGTSKSFGAKADGIWYFHVRARDGAGNWGETAHYRVKIDATPPPPPTGVDDGVSGWSSDNTPTFTWGSPGDTSGIDGYWWAVDDPTPETGGTWTTAPPATTGILGDGPHTFYVKAQNGSGLIGAAGSHDCQIDATPPGAPTGVDDGVVGWSSDNTPTFSWGSPGDTSGIDGYWWAVDDPTPETGGTWTTAPPATTATLGDGPHTFYVKARNGSGLIGAAGIHDCQIDATPPTGTILINGGVGYTNSTSVTLTLSASDTNEVSLMMFKNAGESWSLEQPYATTKSWILTSGDGTKTVYVKYKDSVGNWSGDTAISDTIILDNTPPGAPTGVDDGVSGWSSDNTPAFSWGSPGDTSGIDGYWWAVDNPTPETGGTWTTATTATTGILGDGAHTFYVKARNGSGLIGAAGNHPCQIDATAPGVPTGVDDGVSGWSSDNTPTFSWGSPGDTSGIDGYWWAVDDPTPETGGTWTTAISATTATLGDGAHTFYVKARNGSGLIGAAGNHPCQIDATAPGAPTGVDDGVSGWSSDNTPAFTWGSPGDTSGIDGYWWAVDDTTPETGGTWTTAISATTATLGDGAHTFYVKARNGSGLIGAAGIHDCQIDATPPGAPTVTSSTHPDQDTWYNNDDPSFSWSATDPSGIDGYSYDLDQTATTIPDETSEGTGTSTSYTDKANGTWWFHVKAKNGSGLWGDTAHYKVNIDVSGPAAPTVTSSTHPDQDTWYDNNDPFFSWSATDPSGIDGYSYDLDQTATTIPDEISEGTGTSTSYTNKADGTWWFHVRAKNGSGSWGGTAHYRVNIDVSLPGAPTVTSSTHPDQDTWYSNDDLSFSWSAGDTSGITGYSYDLDQAATTIPDEISEGTGTSTSYTDKANGTWWFHVKAKNGSGLWGETAHYQVNIDVNPPGAPTVTSSSHPDQDTWYSDDDPSFSWSATATSGITGYSYDLDQAAITIPDTASEGTGTSMSYTDKADGTWWFHVRAKNGSGLWGETSHYRVNIDITGPGAPTGVDDGVDGWSSDNTPTFIWGSPGDTSGIVGYWWAVDNPTPETGGTWTTAISATTATLGDGPHTFYVKAENGSGLIGAAGNHDCQIDATPPGAPTSVDDGVSGWSSDNTPAFTWGSPGDTSGVDGYWWAVDNPTPEAGGTWTTATSATTATLGDGPHTFYVKAENGSGLIGAAGNHPCQIDATAPGAPTVTSSTHPDQETWYNNDDPSFSWSASDTSNITGYSYDLDQTATTIPDEISEGTGTSTSYTDKADGTWWFHVKAKNGSGLWGETAHYQAKIDSTPSSNPTLVLSDQTTGNPDYTNDRLVNVEVGNDSGVVAWLISESQTTQPEKDAPGWGSEPPTFDLTTSGDGLKTVYIWVKDDADNINPDTVSATITLDTQALGNPALVLKDKTTGSTDYTDEQLVNVEVGNDIDAVAWLISETQSTQPEEGAVGWGIEPATFTLSSGDGLKTVYIWVKDVAGNVNTAPVSATITLDTQALGNPTLVLKSQTTESTDYTDERLVDVEVGNDIDAVVWLISESQSSKPAEDISGWSSEPDTFSLSSEDGLKTVYIWVKGAGGNVNTAPVSATITLDTIPPLVTSMVDSGRMLSDGEVVAVLPETGMEAEFSKVMRRSAVEEGLELIALKNNLDEEINQKVSLNFDWFADSTTIRLTPDSGKLEKNYLYKLQATDKVTDLAGNTIEGKREIIFRTIMDHTKKNVVSKETDGRIIVTLEANALARDGYLVINKEPLTNPEKVNPQKIIGANEKIINNGNSYQYPIDGCLWEFNVYDEDGKWMEDGFKSEVKITLPYTDEGNGTVGIASIPVREETLLAFWLNEEHSNWVRVPGSRVDRDKDVVTVKVPKFSVYALMSSGDYDLSEAHAYPVPWKPNDGKYETGTEEEGITFTNLSAECVIEIYTISGELVMKHEYKGGGNWTWDVKTTPNKEKVFSGVYIYYIKNDKEHKTGRLMIIR